MPVAAAYIRVSTEDQIEFSPDSQLRMICAYAARNDILLPEKYIFQDEGISGRNAGKRPAFMEMIGIAKQKPKPFDVILVWKFSRFARSRQDSIFYKSMLRKDCGIDVVSITEQLSDDPTAMLVEALLEAMDEYYSINLAQEVKRGMDEKFSRGGVVSVPPFGYKMGEDRFEIESEKAELVQMMFADFLNGLSYRRIAEKLNMMHVLTNRGNRFAPRTVEYILANPTYLGKLRRSTKSSCGDSCLQDDGMQIVAGAHVPIIREEIFNAVQERIAGLRKTYTPYTRTSCADFMLRGLVRCSNCGSTLTRSGNGLSLQCSKYARGQCGESHFITLEKLNRVVLEKLSEDQDAAESIVSVDREVTAERINGDRLALKREYQCLDRIKAAYEAGVDDLLEYTHRKEEIGNRIRMLKQNLQAASNSICGSAMFQICLKDVFFRLHTLSVPESVKNELIRSIVSKIIFDRKAGTVEIFYYVR